MRACIFLGPTLPLATARQHLDATFLPPVQQGDVLRALADGPDAIGIIDGYFELVPAVWHKEILLALERGVHVFGASSMGALRAAELADFGMAGVGAIFRDFASGVLTDDDEVAVVHGPAELGYPPLSHAMVDIRDSCTAAVACGVLSAAVASRLVSIAKVMHFADRSYVAVAKQAADQGVPKTMLDAWQDFVARRGPGLKQRDALELLQTMKSFLQAPGTPFKARFATERSEFLQRLVDEVRLAGAAAVATAPQADASAVDTGREGQLRRDALLRLIARAAGERQGWTVPMEEADQQARELCRRWGMESVEALRGALARVALDEDAFWQYVHDECMVERLARLHGDEVSAALPDQLRVWSLSARLR